MSERAAPGAAVAAGRPAVRSDGRGRDVLVVALFFFSGAAGLVYEVLWNRMLALEMGNSAHSLATILTVFMGGLALGSFVGGRYAARIRNGLRVYGVLEVLIGVWCAALPFAIDALHPAMAWVYQAHYGSFATFNLVQFGLCGLVLLPPVTLMGATLPVVAEQITRRADSVSSSVGLVYAVNTTGAFAGCIVAGLVLIPELGVSTTNAIAVALNVGVGALAIAASFGAPATPHLASADDGRTPGAGAPSGAGQIGGAGAPQGIPTGLLLAGFGLSGFAAMAYQVAWTRLISLSIGSATYAFTVIVGAFILGLALGAAVLGRLGDHDRRTVPLLVGAQLLLALSAVALIPLLGELPGRVARLLYENRDSFLGVQRAEFGAIFLLLLVPTFLMGGILPLVCRVIVRQQPIDVGAALGRAYASNTLGTILGSFLAGFVLVPWIGMRGAIGVGVAANALVGAAWLYAARRNVARALPTAIVAGAVPLVAFALVPSWNPLLINAAPYIDGPFVMEALNAPGAAPGQAPMTYEQYVEDRYDLVWDEEDVATTVSITVDRYSGEPELRVGGKIDARKFHSSQALLAHLPLLLHPNPEDVLIIGLGSGGTLASAVRHPELQSVDAVELSPGVVEASKRFFDRGPVFSDPRVDMIVGDGRLHVGMTDRRYDVIVSQPSNPWIVGASSLFTQEAFDAMRDHLKPGGLVCVWMQGFQVGPEAVRTLCATFAASFEHMELWEGRSREEYYLTGWLDGPGIEVERIGQRLAHPTVQDELRACLIADAADLLGAYVGDRAALARWIEGTQPSTDDHNLLEARIPRGLLRGSSVAVLETLTELRRPVTEHVSIPAGAAWGEAFRTRADAIFRSKPLELEAFRSMKVTGQISLDLGRRIAELNPQDEFAQLYLRQTAGTEDP